jgi:N-acetylmuramoyl-L-alanine amidase
MMNMLKLTLDAGHALVTKGKESPAREKEWTFNNKQLLACQSLLERYEGVQILRVDDPTGKYDVPLEERVDKSNAFGAHAYVAFHNNALAFKWGEHEGMETFSNKGPNSKSEMLQKCIHFHLIKATKNTNRGMKKESFYVLKKTVNCAAVLTESFFMDSVYDIEKLRSDRYLKETGEAIALGIIECYDLKEKEQKSKVKMADSADGKLVRGEQGSNVKLLNNMLHTLEYTRKTDDLFDQYTEAALKAFQKDYGIQQDAIYTSEVGRVMVKAIKEKNALKKTSELPDKNPEMYRLAKLIDTGNPALIESLLKEGFKILEIPTK